MAMAATVDRRLGAVKERSRPCAEKPRAIGLENILLAIVLSRRLGTASLCSLFGGSMRLRGSDVANAGVIGDAHSVTQ